MRLKHVHPCYLVVEFVHCTSLRVILDTIKPQKSTFLGNHTECCAEHDDVCYLFLLVCGFHWNLAHGIDTHETLNWSLRLSVIIDLGTTKSLWRL